MPKTKTKTAAVQNAPTVVTDAMIEEKIVDARYYRFPNTTLTVCALTLRNGFVVTGSSACADPSKFNRDMGRKLARDDARRQIWELEGYLLRERLSRQ